MIIQDLDFNKIEKIDFPDEKYDKEVYDKKQIVLHHTVSNPKTSEGDINYWKNSKGRISTPFIIELDGDIKQCFSSKYWAHHLGVNSKIFTDNGLKPNNTNLNKESIGVELDNWGQLTRTADDYRTVYGSNIDHDLDVVYYDRPFRGFDHYQKYSNEQLESAGELLYYLCNEYNIQYKYDHGMWDVSKDALSGKEGIWTHVSYRPDKFDCHPQAELIDMLKSI